MKYFFYSIRKSKFFMFWICAMGFVNSMWATIFIILLNNKINSHAFFLGNYEGLLFLFALCVSFIMTKTFQAHMLRLTFNYGKDLECELIDMVRHANYENYILIGEEKIRSVTYDISVLQKFPIAFVDCLNASILILIGLGYFYSKNYVVATLLVFLIAILIFIYNKKTLTLEKKIIKTRDLMDEYLKNISDFLEGFKEIKMSSIRSKNLFKMHIVDNKERSTNITISTYSEYLVNELFGYYAFYIAIGFILYVVPLFDSHGSSSLGIFVIILLFISGPVRTLVIQLREFAFIKTSTKRIEDFRTLLGTLENENDDEVQLPCFKNLSFTNAVFVYPSQENIPGFKVGPINLTIKKGDCIFITGGNGSGKSTFIYLLSGLFKSSEGYIKWNGEILDNNQYVAYRNSCCAIFSNSFLFENNYDNFDFSHANKKLVYWLERMDLLEVIKFSDNKVNLKLSKGQSKRLGLIFAILEDKEVFILDEWAADQDPYFKKLFYESILSELLEMGKTLILVSHDDNYFKYAKRLIAFDYGNIIKDEMVISKK